MARKRSPKSWGFRTHRSLMNPPTALPFGEQFVSGDGGCRVYGFCATRFRCQYGERPRVVPSFLNSRPFYLDLLRTILGKWGTETQYGLYRTFKTTSGNGTDTSCPA
jgi:hypothetical protein